MEAIVDRVAYLATIKNLESGLLDDERLKRELVEGARLRIGQQKFQRLSKKHQTMVRRGTMKIQVPDLPEPTPEQLEMAKEMVRREVARLKAEVARLEALATPSDPTPTPLPSSGGYTKP